MFGFLKRKGSAKPRDPATGAPFDAAVWVEESLAHCVPEVRATMGVMQMQRDLLSLIETAVAENRMSRAEADATWAAYDAEIARRFGAAGPVAAPAGTTRKPAAAPVPLADIEAAAIAAARSAFDTTIDGSRARAEILAERARGNLRQVLDDAKLDRRDRKRIEQAAEVIIAEEMANCVFSSSR